MVEWWGGVGGCAEGFESGEGESSGVEGGRGVDVEGGQGAEEEGQVEAPGDPGQRIRFSISARRIRVGPGERRQRYIGRLEELMAECDRMLVSPGGRDEVRVKVMGVLIRAIKAGYGMVVDVEVEELEREVRELEEAERELKAEPGEEALGYRVQ